MCRRRQVGGVILLLGGLGLAGCGSSEQGAASQSSAIVASSSAIETVAPMTTAPSTPAWSNEAVVACRTFVNELSSSGMGISGVQSLLKRYEPGMSAEDYSVATTGWGLTVANVELPPGLGRDAEPEVYEALNQAATAMELPVASPELSVYESHKKYVDAMVKGFEPAVEICTEVGVIPER